MRLEWLHYFQTVIDCGSMTRAAKELFCSQPAVSNAIKAIEQELGSPILDRSTTGISLTTLGETVLQDTNLILSYVDNWKALANDEQERQAISLVLTGTAPRDYLVSCIMQLKKENRFWDINLKYVPGQGGASPFFSISSESHRFAISYRIPDHLPNAIKFTQNHGMRLAILQHDEFWLFFNSNNPLAALERDLVWDDVRNREVLLYQDPNKFPYLKKLMESNCKIGTQMWQEENMMLALSLDDKAVSFRPKKTVSNSVYTRDGYVTMRPISNFSMPVNLCLFLPNQERITPNETKFIERFRTFFPEFEFLN